MKSRFGLFVSLSLLLTVSMVPVIAQPPLPPPPDLEALLKKANGKGKYAMLLFQVHAPDDEATWGSFNDRGFHPEGAVGNDINVPAGYRVYAAPYWFIWRDQRMEKRPWGPEQITGEPDTAQRGDVQTAWASKTQDEQDEWVLLEYDAPLMAAAVTIYETHNPGAVSKITAFTLDGREEALWAGQDNPPEGTIFINQKNFPRAIKTNRIKLYLDSKRVPGWNEIDAVGLIDKAGKTQWARSVECSSTYAGATTARTPGGFIPRAPEGDILTILRQMQNDVNELRQKAGLPPRALLPLPDPQPNLDLFLGALIEEEILDLDVKRAVKPVAPPRAAPDNPIIK